MTSGLEPATELPDSREPPIASDLRGCLVGTNRWFPSCLSLIRSSKTRREGFGRPRTLVLRSMTGRERFLIFFHPIPRIHMHCRRVIVCTQCCKTDRAGFGLGCRAGEYACLTERGF